MVPRTPLSTIDTWGKENRTVSKHQKWDELLGAWGRAVRHQKLKEAQRGQKHVNQRKVRALRGALGRLAAYFIRIT